MPLPAGLLLATTAAELWVTLEDGKSESERYDDESLREDESEDESGGVSGDLDSIDAETGEADSDDGRALAEVADTERDAEKAEEGEEAGDDEDEDDILAPLLLACVGGSCAMTG